VLENNTLLVKVGLKFANIFVTLLANFEILRINRGHTFYLTPSPHEILFQIFRCFEASTWECVNPIPSILSE
jgi:hypothetical protein